MKPSLIKGTYINPTQIVSVSWDDEDKVWIARMSNGDVLDFDEEVALDSPIILNNFVLL